MLGPEELVAALLCVLLVLVSGVGLLQCCLAFAFFGMFLLPRVVYGGSQIDMTHVGIAGAGPRVMTYSLAILLILTIALPLPRVRSSWRAVTALIGFLLVWSVLYWPRSEEVSAGTVHLIVAACAWAAGGVVSRLANQHERGLRVVATWAIGWATFQCLVAVVQFLGADIYPRSAGPTTDETLVGRIGGTLGHPSTIGKLIFLLLIVTLPWLSSPDRVLRRRSSIASLLMIVPLVLSGGRANAAAAASMAVLALAFEPGPQRWSRRLRLAAVISVAGILSAGYWAQRFAAGEDGSTRAHLNEVATEYLRSGWSWWSGTGPNTYVTAVGQTDWLTSAGWPVHNYYLLALVELGVIGTALLLAPIAVASFTGWRGHRPLGWKGAQARVLLASVPGMLMITTTGWGMMADSLVPWMFVLGFSVDQVKSQRRPRSRQDAGTSSGAALLADRIGAGVDTLNSLPVRPPDA